MHANFSNCGTPSETCGWLAPTGACAAPAWARWPYLEPWVATIAFFVWIALYKTLECGGDVRAAIKAQVDGDEKHVRIAGVGYFIGIYLFKQIAPPAEIDWSCPSPGFLVVETAVGVLAYDAIFYVLHRLMHAFAYRLHARHHSSGPRVNAQEVLNQSVVDASLQVLTNILVQRRGLRGPKNWLARIMHNIIVTLLLTDSHADTPWRLSDMFPRLLPGAARHREHHATGGPPYQQFFGFMDAAFSPSIPEAPAKKVV